MCPVHKYTSQVNDRSHKFFPSRSRSQHEKAVQYFQRALKLNPNYLSAWTLMGHEFMELKNTNAAIDCYRKAISKFNLNKDACHQELNIIYIGLGYKIAAWFNPL